MAEGTVVTKECKVCGHLFERVFVHAGHPTEGTYFSRQQRLCPVCQGPVFVVEVPHPGEAF